jgi:hypothetical protein
MWEKVQNRLHRPLKIFPYGPNANEVMLFGTVQYGLKSGGQSSVDWAAYARLKKVDGSVKMDFYQVYLVSSGGQTASGCNTELRIGYRRSESCKMMTTRRLYIYLHFYSYKAAEYL